MILPPFIHLHCTFALNVCTSLTFADLCGRHGFPSISVIPWFAPLTPMSLCVVLAVVADSTTAFSRCQPNTQVKMAAVSMVVTATLWWEREEYISGLCNRHSNTIQMVSFSYCESWGKYLSVTHFTCLQSLIFIITRNCNRE